jgi:hypothetical protein
MTPQQAAALVGHSPDIVERLEKFDKPHSHAGQYRVPICGEAAAVIQHLRADLGAFSFQHTLDGEEIERLRTALRSVREILRQARCQTDLGWAEQRVSDALEIISNALRETKP